MSTREKVSSALTVAGSDSGGGAGIQADLKTFAAHGVHGLSAITCLTAQNPKTILGVQPASAKLFAQQLEAIAEFKPAAMKTGMLYSKALIEIVKAFVASRPRTKLVIDPVMIATSGATLLNRSATLALKSLLPFATLVTPNIPEAEALCGEQIRTIEDQRDGVRLLFERFGAPVLLKGGHAKGAAEVADIFYDGSEELLLAAPMIRGVHTHGTGCTLSAAITANLALKHSLTEAVTQAKSFITGAIANSGRASKFDVLNLF